MSQVAPPKLTLEITPPGQASFVRVVEAMRTIIGRESGDIEVSDPETSALHAEIDCSGGHAIVRDLGSRNGTWRAGERLPQFALYQGQTFFCGATAIRLVSIEGDFPVAKAGQTAVGSTHEAIKPSDTLTRGTPDPPAPPTPQPMSTTLVGSAAPADAAPPFAPPPGWRASTTEGETTQPGDEPWPDTPSTTRVNDWQPATTPSFDNEESTVVTDVAIPPLGSPAPTSKTTESGSFAQMPGPELAVTTSTTAPPSSTATAPGAAANPVTALPTRNPGTAGATAPPPSATVPMTSLASTAPSASSPTAPASGAPSPAQPLEARAQEIELPPIVDKKPDLPPRAVPGRRARPVANAVIKDPAAAAGNRVRTGAQPAAGGTRWGRLFMIGSITTVIAACLGGLAYFVYTVVAGRTLAFTEEVASGLPDDTIGMVALASPGAVLDLLDDAIGESTKTDATGALGFDPFHPAALTNLGVDVNAPVGVALLSSAPVVLALRMGVSDRETLWEKSSALAVTYVGGSDVAVERKSYAEAEGWRLSGSAPVAAVFTGDVLTIVWAPGQANADLVDGKARAIAEVESGSSLADRPGFDQLVPPKGHAIASAYVDSASLAASLPGNALTPSIALADTDAFAATLAYDRSEVRLGLQAVVREGARPLEVARSSGRRPDALKRLGPPMLGTVDGAVNPEALDRSLGGLASMFGLSLSVVEKDVAQALGVGLRDDLMKNLRGDFGWALSDLHAGEGKAEFGAVAWLGLLDDEKAEAMLQRVAAKFSEGPNTIEVEVVEGTNVLVPKDTPAPVRVFAHEGALWLSVGETDIASLIKGPKESFLDDARHEQVSKAVRKGALVAGFVDIKSALGSGSKLLPDAERADLKRASDIVDLLEVLSLRIELRRRTFVAEFTLHTSSPNAFPTLLQGVARLAGNEVASSAALAARAQRCSALAEHVVGLTRKALEDAGSDLDAAWEVERRVLEECEGTKMTDARLDCYLTATSIDGLKACDRRHPERATGGDEGGVAANGEGGEALPIEPIPVPYVDDIWPHLGDDPDSDKPQPEVNYGVPAGKNSPSRGPADALITIVEFGDFECPYCKRVTSTVDEVLSKHGKDVRFVFRHNPLERIHDNARSAARAAIAAGKQGKFWELHDKLFENQSRLGKDQVRKMAESIGLDMARYDRDVAASDTDRQLQRDIDVAKKFGAAGTPAFFVNGRYLGGAQTKSAFNAIIAEEKARALKFVERRGGTKLRLYEDMRSHFAPAVLKPGATTAPPGPDEKRYIVSTKGLPVKGATGFARVQVVECGDFDCPFCARARKTVDKMLAAYPSQVAFFFAHDPLTFHAGAEPAARAAVAADNQDKFWEMHDMLFEQQDGTARDEADFVRYAKKIGLNMETFKTDFAATETAQTVESQRKACVENEGNATPTFFINGRRVTGALELSRFKALIDDELAAGI